VAEEGEMIERRSVMIGGALALADISPALAQSPDTLKLRDELMALETASWGYMRDKNYDGMRNYMADDGLLIFSDGTRYNKRETLAIMKDYKLDSFTIEPTYAVRMITPDVATLLYRVTYTSSAKGGPPQTVTTLSSSVYVRRDGKWWSALYQESRIK
jgi:uncharacterized protein (TIGR02246 family)